MSCLSQLTSSADLELLAAHTQLLTSVPENLTPENITAAAQIANALLLSPNATEVQPVTMKLKAEELLGGLLQSKFFVRGGSTSPKNPVRHNEYYKFMLTRLSASGSVGVPSTLFLQNDAPPTSASKNWLFLIESYEEYEQI